MIICFDLLLSSLVAALHLFENSSNIGNLSVGSMPVVQKPVKKHTGRHRLAAGQVKLAQLQGRAARIAEKRDPAPTAKGK